MAFNPLARLTGTKLRICIFIASTIGFVLFGYDNGVFSGLIVNPWFLVTFNNPEPKLLGTVSATYNLGGFVGSIIAFSFGHILGRRRAILTGICITAIGAIPFATATNIATLVSGRVVCGIGVGVLSSTVGLWQAETAPANSRGRYLVAQLLCGANLGLFLAQWINYGFYAQTGRAAFVFPVAFQLVWLLIAGTLVLGLPESPRWLAKYDRTDEALEILTRLLGPEQAQQAMQQILESNELENRVSGGQISALLRNGPTQNFRRVCLACGVMIMHQLNGVNSVTYYLPTLLQTFLGTGHRETLWIAGLSSIDSTVFVLISALTVDKVGRKPYLFYGSIFQACTFIIIASILGTAPPGSQAFGTAAVVMLYVYYGGNSLCWLGCSWAYPAEILPLQIREKGLALGNCGYWLFQFMMVEITPIALENIYYRYYIILAVFNACNAVVLWFFYPETKKLSLEELDFFFANKYGYDVPMKEVALENAKKNDIERVETVGHVSD